MARPPNVVLIVTDQQRWDTLRCYGRENAETPNLDWLAATGTIFDAAYTATPSCIPARASLMTGQDPWHTGILGMGGGQPQAAGLTDTLAGSLAAAGYHAQSVGKLHVEPPRALIGFHRTELDEALQDRGGFVSDYRQWFARHAPAGVGPFDHGIDVNSWMSRPWHVADHLHPSAWTVARSVDALEHRDPTKPFFLNCSFHRPHSPFDPPQYYFDLHSELGVPDPVIGDWAADHEDPDDGADPNAWHGRRTAAETARARAGYQGSISFIDHQLGRLWRHLTHHGLWDDTMIIFTADHGEMAGDHHLWRKTYAYEGSAHIPMLIKLPGQRPGDGSVRRSDAPVCLQDVMPTILDACGAPVPDAVDGHSLLPLITGDAAEVRPYVHGEHSTCYHPDNEMQYLVDRDWKYIWFPRGDREQLFCLRTDPGELHDLAGDPDHADELATWRARLVEILAARDAGLTDGNRLVDQTDRPFLVSPAAEHRRAPIG